MSRAGWLVAALSWLGLFCPALAVRPAGDAELSYQRLCEPGASRLYELERLVYKDGLQTYRATAVSSHTVLGCDAYQESVRFQEFLKFDGTQPLDLSPEAMASPSFSITLSSGMEPEEAVWSPPVPANLDETLRGMVRDLRTVLISAGPAAGLGGVRKIGDVYVRPTLRRSHRAAAQRPGVRDSCSSVRLELRGLTPTQVSIRTSLVPPDSPCLAAAKPWMGAPVETNGPANNFQQVVCENRLCSVRWGRDQTVVEATLDREAGTLLSAELEHSRILKERTRCDVELERCSPESPFLSQRRFTLKLRQAPPWSGE